MGDFKPNPGLVLAGPRESCHYVPMAPRDLDRLAVAAQKRRHELGLALNDKNAKDGGTSKGTWTRVEKGLSIRPTNYVKIDGLLRWAPGSCLRVLDGREPVPIQPASSSLDANISELSPDVLDEQARDVVKLAAIATTKGMTAEEIKKLSDRVVRDLKARGLI